MVLVKQDMGDVGDGGSARMKEGRRRGRQRSSPL